MDWLRIGSITYWAVFVVTFLSVASWESARPTSPLSIPAERRFARHGILLLLSAITITALRLSPLAVAIRFAGTFGVFHQAAVPYWVAFTATIVLLDLLKYAVHRLFHSVAWLWSVHEVHHSDPDFDVSTAGRAHPIESVAVQGAQVLLVVLLGCPPEAVASALVIGVFFSLFEHANASLPAAWNRWLGCFIITPDVHRIHHSQELAAQNQNFGEVFPWWDQLFGTYTPSRDTQAEPLLIGLARMRQPDLVSLKFLLSEPFMSEEQKFDRVDRASGRPV